MPNLPAKQSNFTRIRNNILNRALENNFTRKIIANFLPTRYGSDLIKFVSNDDTPDFEKTARLIASMDPKAINTNFKFIQHYIYKDEFFW